MQASSPGFLLRVSGKWSTRGIVAQFETGLRGTESYAVDREPCANQSGESEVVDSQAAGLYFRDRVDEDSRLEEAEEKLEGEASDAQFLVQRRGKVLPS